MKKKYAGLRSTPAKLPLDPKPSFLLAYPLLISEVILFQVKVGLLSEIIELVQFFALLFKTVHDGSGRVLLPKGGRELAGGMQRDGDAPGACPMQVTKSQQ